MSQPYDTTSVASDASVPETGTGTPGGVRPAGGPSRAHTPNLRPDLTGTMLHLPPGQWWSDDGWLHVEVERIGRCDRQDDLPDGWAWAQGTLYLDGEGVDVCTVPVRLDALPALPPSPTTPAAATSTIVSPDDPGDGSPTAPCLTPLTTSAG
jgi:hypothetical protein